MKTAVKFERVLKDRLSAEEYSEFTCLAPLLLG
jgi:hypothetical protein